MLPARTLLSRRRHWRNRRRVRRLASGRTIYNYFRDYDPQTGRYPQSDPIGLNGGINTYAYAMSNPLMYVDPRGLDAVAPTAPWPGTVPGVRPFPGWLRPPNPWLFIFWPSGLGDSDLGIQTDPGADLVCRKPSDLDKDEECYEKCKHLLPSPSGDLQASEYRKCYRECKGSL